jgi:UDP-N-acetyl-D-galactosamine dehydrogenase
MRESLPATDQARVGVIGLGYVGLPLAVAFGRRMPTVGYDIDPGRIAELRGGRDRTREVSPAEFVESDRLVFTDVLEDLRDSNVYVVAVPTPIDEHKRPDLSLLELACRFLAGILKRGDVVVFESTVYPGVTEDICVPALEKFSDLQYNRDFFVGYSPERINPGDRQHRLADNVKVVAGSTPQVADFLEALYGCIVEAGIHKAGSIRVAEAAKVIENTQRDVNIALVNELALICNRLGIDTAQVLAAAGTKWNFLPFRPGLVGGHCIGVDPYYLTHKAEAIGYHPQVILAGRRINDGMGAYVASRVAGLVSRAQAPRTGARVLILGLAFKENCPDVRNTRVVDLVRELERHGFAVDVQDPLVDAGEVPADYDVNLVGRPEAGRYDAVVLAVAHDCFRSMGGEAVRALGKPGCVVYDVKSVLPADQVDGRL